MPVHNHSPEEGRGLLCPESRQSDGSLLGVCMQEIKPVLDIEAVKFNQSMMDYLKEKNDG